MKSLKMWKNPDIWGLPYEMNITLIKKLEADEFHEIPATVCSWIISLSIFYWRMQRMQCKEL